MNWKKSWLKQIATGIWLSSLTVFLGCGSSSEEEKKEQPVVYDSLSVFSSFESGNIGNVKRNTDSNWIFYLRDDNNNHSLSDKWRNWWYAGVYHVPHEDQSGEGEARDFRVDITWTNRGWPYLYLPVYSYDQKNWQRFQEKEVSLVSGSKDLRLIQDVENSFEQDTVWMARFYPYTFSDLEAYTETIRNNPYVTVSISGTTQEGRPIYLWRIENGSVPNSSKEGVLIHARTHPAETSGSFVVEGLVEYLIRGQGVSLLDDLVFYIVPMHNVDGVVEGNYRTTPKSENLENMWFRSEGGTKNLTDQSPKEVSVLHSVFLDVLQEIKVSMALNLHASNGHENLGTFFFPHFGTVEQGYSEAEANLWKDQIRFIESLRQVATGFPIEPNPTQGGRGFVSKYFPESWWWEHYQDSVMAMTMEMTYGKSGKGRRWIVPEDMRKLGEHLGESIGEYYKENTENVLSKVGTGKVNGKEFEKRMLEYPGMYPPAMEGEGKE